MKLFVISDIHGYYDEMIVALNEAGFDPKNENHMLITCGDHFDRGAQPGLVMKYLRNLPRKVLVRGNHEQLLEELCERGFSHSYDYSNGTVATVNALGWSVGDDFYEQCVYVQKRVKSFFDEMVDYFETENYIFVHSWIPLINKDGLPAHHTRGRKFKFNPDWRNASKQEWEDARWGNPYALAAEGLKPDKTIVFGHWHCSTGWVQKEGCSEFGDDAKFDIFYGDGFISIDACTAHTHKVNVLVLEDDLLDG